MQGIGPNGTGCHDCKFSVVAKGMFSTTVYCHRLPPVMVYATDQATSLQSHFPQVDPTAWCGEWKNVEDQ